MNWDQTAYRSHNNVVSDVSIYKNALLMTNVVYGNGYWIEMSLRMLSNACLDLPWRSRHINSSRYPDSSSSWQPLMRFSLIFTLFQYDSTFSVWTPVVESTNSTEWLTVA